MGDSALARLEPGISNRTQDPRVKRLLDEHHRLSLRIEELVDEVETIKSSRSWKITAPLRLIKPFIGYIRSLFAFTSHKLTLATFNHISRTGDFFTVVGSAPSGEISSSHGRMPVGWIQFRQAKGGSQSPREFDLYYDNGQGFSEQRRVRLSFADRETQLVKLPRLVRSLRLDFKPSDGRFEWHGFFARERSAPWVILRALIHKFKSEGYRAGIALGQRLLQLFSVGGSSLLWHELLQHDLPREEYIRAYQAWIGRFDRLTESARRKIREEIQEWKEPPLISVIMPVYNTPERWLRAAIESVLRQLYPKWELCIADDASTRPHVRAVLQEYSERDPRIKVITRHENGHISEASNSALALASGEYIALLDHDDELSEHALYYIVKEVMQDRSLDLIYSDEDRVTSHGQRIDPYFKPDWNPELLLGQNFISHLGVYRTSLSRSVGGFRRGYEGSQDWDFTLRFSENTSPARIKHVPKVLYHWRDVPGTISFTLETKIDAFSAAKRAVEDAIKRRELNATVKRDGNALGGFGHRLYFALPSERPKVSVIALASGGEIDSENLHDFVAELREKTDYPFEEVLLVTSKDRRSVSSETDLPEDVKAFPVEDKFLISALNLAVDSATGELICFLSAGLRPLNKDWLSEMVSLVMQKGIAGVGGKLISEDGTLVSAGPLIGLNGIVGDALSGVRASSGGYFGRAALLREISSLSIDCMLIRKTPLKSVKGFSPELPDRIVDLDLSLKLRKEGSRLLWTPHAEFLLHGEGKRFRLRQSARRALSDTWREEELEDRFYNPNLSLNSSDYFLAFPPRRL